MAEGDSAMTSAKDAFSDNPKEKQEPEGNTGLKETQTLEGILSLHPADIQSTTGSGATPIGSADRAPDRNKKQRIRRI